MTYSAIEIWTIIVIMGIGTFLIRFSFLGLIGDRPMPGFVLRLLRYTRVHPRVYCTPHASWQYSRRQAMSDAALRAACAAGEEQRVFSLLAKGAPIDRQGQVRP